MFEFFQKLFSTEFMPHGHCYFWQPAIVWLHVISDSLIVISYYSIPVALVYFVRKRKDLAFNWMFVLFAIFILACGTTHLMEIWNIWHGNYLISGLVKFVTAIASIPTAILLWPLIPRALKLPSPASLEEANKALALEVSERKRAEAEVRQFNEKLESNIKEATAKLQSESRLKDDFLATLSHELRTPLNAILGWVQLIRRRNSTENFERGMEIIEKNARLQVQLIEDLLDTSRITSGKLRIEMKHTDLVSVVDSAIASIEPTAETKFIQVQKDLDSSIGFVNGDAARLQQIVWNLLSNAVKFTPKGGKIEVSLVRKGDWVEIVVVDSGVGITSEFLPYIFDRFRQADSSTSRKYSGLGLGLSVAKHLVELHGGSIQAHSLGEGKGAKFVVKLPIVADRSASSTHSSVQALSNSHQKVRDFKEISLQDLCILVVDDELDAREVIKGILEDCGAKVLTAGSTDEALEVFSNENIDILVSDIGMPNRDGYDLIHAVRGAKSEKMRAVPAIALTAFARAEDRKRTAESGYQSHLAKPVEANELIAVVEELVRIRSSAGC